MRKRNKIIIAISGLCLIYISVGYLLPIAGIVWLHERDEYSLRPIECSPNDLIPDLEKTFDINFPKVIKEIKTAKTLGSWDSNTIHFIVKFCAEPDIVDTFVKSFPRGIGWGSYDPEWDMRSVDISHAPDWFTETITQGKMGDYWLAGPKMSIYIDTSVETNFVVYLHGFY